MDDLVQRAIELQEEFEEASTRKDRTDLQPKVETVIEKLTEQGLTVPRRLRQIRNNLRLEDEDDFFDNMPV